MLAALAGAAYVPLLLTAPGQVGADTKSYLYIDPGRLLARALSMWDPHIGLGTVTHQNIGYLFPMGPFFWLAEAIGLPDWVAQRLWLGSILFAAGAGVAFLARQLRLPAAAASVAVFAYALTPYTLTLAARISVILLPFAGLPWLIALTIRSVRRGGWRDPALFALVVLTIGGVNATALVFAAVGPMLWLVWAVVAGEASWRRSAAAATRIGALSVGTSLWWLAGLWAQGGYGIDILRYTETAETVASGSVAVEVLRGLGYWFFYGGDRFGPWIEPGSDYTQRLWLIAITFVLPVLSLLGAAVTRWRHRAYFVALLVAGMFISVGAHPWDDAPLAGRLWKAVLLSERGLALRSTPRAVPLVALAMSVLLAVAVAVLVPRLPVLAARAAPIFLVLVAIGGNLPLWTGGMVADNLRRPEDIPTHWLDAAAFLDSSGSMPSGQQTRVLEVPGLEFASYRWGNTVDPITPGLMDRPYVARELIPYGTPPSADLLNALDRRLQENVLDPEAIAPIARLMGVGAIVSRNDAQYERYRAARPYALAAVLDAAPGVRHERSFGPAAPIVEDPLAPLLDELRLAHPADALVLPPVAVRTVRPSVPITRAKPAVAPVVVAGDGEGLVSTAAAGLIDGTELVRYSASMSERDLRSLPDGARLVLTDSNRRRGRRWYSVRENVGYTEAVGETPLVVDLSDNRLDPFGGDPSGRTQSVAVHRGGVLAQATSYGNPNTLTPEHRPSNAVDGDPSTVWRTAAGRDARGERLVLSFADPVTTGSIGLRQLPPGWANRRITEVELVFDDDPSSAQRHALDPVSEIDLQHLQFAPRTFRRLAIEIVADSSGRVSRPLRPARFSGLDSVGFAEVDVAGRRADEHIRLPLDLPTGLDRPLSIVLERQRSDPAERVRADEETAIRRTWSLDGPRAFRISGTVRLSAHVADSVVDVLVDADRRTTVESSRRLPGALTRRGSAALDGSAETAWVPAFGVAEDWLQVSLASPATVDSIAPVVVAGPHSLPRQIRIEGESGSAVVDLPDSPVGPDGLIRHPRLPLPNPVTGSDVRVTVTAVDEATTTEWFSGAPIRVPFALAELGAASLVEAAPPHDAPMPDRVAPAIEVDGRAIDVRVRGTVGDALARRGLRVEVGPPLLLDAGEHTLAAVDGRELGFDIDRVVLADGPARQDAPGAGGGPALEITARSDTTLRGRTVGAPEEPFWLVLGQSSSNGWKLEVDGARASKRSLVDGFANGWLIEPDGSAPVAFELRWQPQQVVWAALALSAVAVAVCVGLVIVGRRRAVEALEGHHDTPSLIARPGQAGPRMGIAASLAAAVAVGALAAFMAGPIPGALIAATTVLAARRPAARLAAAVAGPVALGAAAAYVVARQARYRPGPALEWPAELAAVHQLAWTAVLLVVAVVVVDGVAARVSAAKTRGSTSTT